ncbi:hypothetical protein ATANTOWER_018306 [Ataeniobius toweri]|uniref:Uncharacterized protein n=1 Tax=Ataeniobius toweri TaxID=208326 RepID=A0ABU7BHB5_9TELE|nr:hypothetical protein [Ataeniobius toweri]
MTSGWHQHPTVTLMRLPLYHQYFSVLVQINPVQKFKKLIVTEGKAGSSPLSDKSQECLFSLHFNYPNPKVKGHCSSFTAAGLVSLYTPQREHCGWLNTEKVTSRTTNSPGELIKTPPVSCLAINLHQ